MRFVRSAQQVLCTNRFQKQGERERRKGLRLNIFHEYVGYNNYRDWRTHSGLSAYLTASVVPEYQSFVPTTQRYSK